MRIQHFQWSFFYSNSSIVAINKNNDVFFCFTLNFKRIKEMGIPWLLCYAEGDDLVDRDAALAPADFIDVEVTVFPKGHGAIATSWSLPTSECALHRCFKGGYRGPVRYQLDLDGIPEGFT